MVPGQDLISNFVGVFLFFFSFFFERKVNGGHYSYGLTLMLACPARTLITLLISESKCLHYKAAKAPPVGKLAPFLIPLSSVPSIKNALSVWVILHRKNFTLFTALLIWNRENTIFHATISTVKRF